MRIVNRQPRQTADISAEKDSAFPELAKLMMLAIVTILSLYYGIGVLVDFSVSHISYQREAELFRSFSFSDEFFGDRTTDNKEKLLRLQAILDTLSRHRDAPPIPFTLAIIDDVDPNAFAFPGGIIGVTTGMLELIDGEVELAFVLGHELGHFHNRDHLRGLGRAIGVGLGYALVFGGQVESQGLAKVMLSVLERGHSRAQESSADRFGVKLVFDQYGATEGFDRLFRFLQKQHDTPVWTGMFATHPAPGDRITELLAYVDQLESF